MWLSKERIVRRRLRVQDVRVSSLNALEKPLADLGFKPQAFVMVLLDVHRPICAYTFRRSNEMLSVFFSRASPYRFVYDNKRFPYRSIEFETINDLESGLARFFRIPNFSPKVRPVIDWPVRKPLPPLIAEDIVPCPKTPKAKSKLPA